MKISFKPLDPNAEPLYVPRAGENLSLRLEGKDELDGVPICRSEIEQTNMRGRKHVMVYPNGNVMIWEGWSALRWDPDVPVSEQPSKRELGKMGA
jgi:hypothetical protein